MCPISGYTPGNDTGKLTSSSIRTEGFAEILGIDEEHGGAASTTIHRRNTESKLDPLDLGNRVGYLPYLLIDERLTKA